MKLHSINTEQRLYVMPAGQGGFSCYGFDVLDKKARAVAEWLTREALPLTSWAVAARKFLTDTSEVSLLRKDLPRVEPGNATHFTLCAAVMDAGAAFAAATGKRCNADLCSQLVGLEGQRVEVAYPDGQTSRFYVGKSTGWMPGHLEIKTRRSHGGGVVYMPAGSTVRVIKQKRS